MDVSAFAQDAFGNAPYVYEMLKKPDGKCIFLHDEKCTVYEVRPLICRFYPFELSTDQVGTCSFGVTDECPGVSHPDTKGVGKRLDSSFFKALFDMARAELNADSSSDA
jgi:Fe-S-cluster containining protein